MGVAESPDLRNKKPIQVLFHLFLYMSFPLRPVNSTLLILFTCAFCTDIYLLLRDLAQSSPVLPPHILTVSALSSIDAFIQSNSIWSN